MLRNPRYLIALLVALRCIHVAASYACAAEIAVDAFHGRGYTVQTDKAGRITSLKAASKAEPFAVRFHNVRIYALRGDYHIIDGFDFRRINDGLPIDTTRFGA